jgi:hypothetical protein
MTFSSLNRGNRVQSRVDPPLESPRQLALIAFVVWLIGVVFHPLGFLVLLGLVLLLVAGAAYLVRPKKHSTFWRGREIDLDDDGGLAQQVYRMVFKR